MARIIVYESTIVSGFLSSDYNPQQLYTNNSGDIC